MLDAMQVWFCSDWLFPYIANLYLSYTHTQNCYINSCMQEMILDIAIASGVSYFSLLCCHEVQGQVMVRLKSHS